MNNRKRVTFVVSIFVLASLLLAVVPSFAQEPIEIQFWFAFSDEARINWTQDKAAEFNKLFPQYNVVAQAYPAYEDLFTAVALAQEQGSAPAIVHYFEAATTDARNSGYYKSVAEAVGDRTEINGVPVDFADYVPAAANYYTLDGKFTSIPWNTSSAIMYVNQDMLDKAGVTEMPKTWADITAACDKIMAMDGAPEYCVSWPNYGWFFEQSLAQQNQDLANNGNGREGTPTELYFNSEAAVAYISWWMDLAQKGYYSYTGKQRDWDGTNDTFTSQKIAIEITSSSDVTYLTNTGAENGFKVVTAFMPYNGEVGWTGNLIGGASLWLTNNLPADAEEGALTFLFWFTNTENAADWHRVTGYVPVRLSAVDLLQSEGWYDEHPNQRAASDQLAQSQSTTATAGALVGNLPLMRDVLTQAIEDLLINGGDVQATMDAVNEECTQILADYNSLYSE